MKEIVFRPLRRVKKTGKIVVASYSQWRRLMSTDYTEFKLIIDDEYKGLNSDEPVYDHKGERLFFWTYNPADIMVIDSAVMLIDFNEADCNVNLPPVPYGVRWSVNGHVNYNMPGADCEGVPAFAHYTAEYAVRYNDVSVFEPLTVGAVTKWFGWLLWQLNNANLQFKSDGNK